MQQRHRPGGDHRRLRRRLGDHGVADHERRRHLAREDRERKIPGADRHEDAAAMQPQHVALAGGSRQVPVLEPACLGGVVAQEVDRLADLGHGVAQGLAALPHAARHEPGGMLLVEVGGAQEASAAPLQGHAVPALETPAGDRQRPVDIGRTCLDHGTDHPRAIGRVEQIPGRPFGRHRRRRHEVGRKGGVHRVRQRLERLRVAQIDAPGVGPVRPVEIAGMHDLWMRRAAERREPARRVLDQTLDRDGGIHQLVDERGVGAVLQQTAHQVGQKVVVAADGRVDPTRDGIVGPDQRAVERLRHAVQALELEIAPRAGQLDDAGDGMRIVGRELRVEGIAAVQQPARAGEIGDVGRELAGQHRVGQALLLGALDLGIPIGALDQAHRDPPAVPARKLPQPGDDVDRALLVGLHREPEPVPAGEVRQGQQALEQIERRLEPVRLLGIDGDRDVAGPGPPCQVDQTRQQLLGQAPVLRHLVARMQRRELDRDAGARHQGLAPCGRDDRIDGMAVGIVIARGHPPPCERPRPACRTSSGSRGLPPRRPGRSPARSSGRGRSAGRAGASPATAPRAPPARPCDARAA